MNKKEFTYIFVIKMYGCRPEEKATLTSISESIKEEKATLTNISIKELLNLFGIRSQNEWSFSTRGNIVTLKSLSESIEKLTEEIQALRFELKNKN